MRRIEEAQNNVRRLQEIEDAHLAAYNYAREQHLAAVEALALAYAELEVAVDVVANDDRPLIALPSPVRRVSGVR